MRFASSLLSSAALVATLALTACNAPQDHNAASVPASPTSSSTTSAAPVASASAGMNTPLTAAQVKVRMTLQGAPTVSADGQSIVVNVDLSNDGAVALESTGSHPVNLGAHSVDAAGKIVLYDFARAALPSAIAANDHAVVSLKISAENSVGYSVQISPVQEGVAWFDGLGVSPLTVGPFKTCPEGVQGKVCDAEGKALVINE
jgi:hypothetical protein